ncbi:MAG: hypothetical protein GX144_07970 [Clostridiaceae bacterium]|nr:hypothetical protein [Clostridiaceae bacterium]
MALNKKEKAMIIVLLLLVYAFAFAKVVVMNGLPQIEMKKETLAQVQAQKAALDADYLNIEAYKAETKAKAVVDERLGDYLMDNASLSDSIKFVEDLAMMLDTELLSISLGAPKAISSNDISYYGFPVSFAASFTYDKFQEIIRYCEGGSQKVGVTGFSLIPSKENDYYDVSLSLMFYSINRGSADKLFEFSRSKFKEFKDREGKPLFIKDNDNLPVFPSTASNEKSDDGKITIFNADFIVFHRGYLFGGYNFETFSSLNSSERSRMTTKEKVDVFLTIEGSSYTLESLDSEGNRDVFTGSIPNRTLTFYMQSNLDPQVKENSNLQVNITIKNDSSNKILAKLEQTGNRIKIMDRDGNVIEAKSDKEKVYF